MQYKTSELNYYETQEQRTGIGNKRADVLIVDGVMGCGKSSSMINYVNNAPDDVKFVYVTPFLSEVKRIKEECKGKNFKEPTTKNNRGTKTQGILNLIATEQNIVTTHALFNVLGRKELQYFSAKNYILILDEVADVVDFVKISRDDYNSIFIKDKYAHIENNRVIWDHKDYSGELEKFKKIAEIGNLYYNDAGNKKEEDRFFTWTFPINIFNAFIKNFVVTYMFEGQIQCAYYKMHDIKYKYVYVKNLKPEGEYSPKNYIFEDALFDNPQEFDCGKYRQLINICYHEKLNSLGAEKNDLCKNWYNKNPESYAILKKNLLNYFTNIAKTPSKDNMWTTFKDYKEKLSGQGYTKGFVSCSSRATNEFRNKRALAYMINRYVNPEIKLFFNSFKISIDESKFALSEMLQWIFRSQIRMDLPINIYIPSKRMRELLEDWLNNKMNFDEDAQDNPEI